MLTAVMLNVMMLSAVTPTVVHLYLILTSDYFLALTTNVRLGCKNFPGTNAFNDDFRFLLGTVVLHVRGFDDFTRPRI
jgi:hypothetical protein